jgi:tetratricopeptide (TPR) repeat protein
MDESSIESAAYLGAIEVVNGNFEKGFGEYQRLLADARTPGDSMVIQQFIRDYYYFRGEFRRGIEAQEFFLHLYSKVAPAIQVSIFRVTRLAEYFEIGMFEEGMQIYKEDIENAEKAYARILEYGKKFGSPSNVELIYKGEIHMLKKEYSEAIESFERFKVSNVYVPGNVVNELIATCHLELKEYEEAIESLQESLVANPYDGESNMLMARILVEQGRNSEALPYLERASKTFEYGDENYAPYVKMMELKAQLVSDS